MKNFCTAQHRSPERNTRELKCVSQKKVLSPKDFLAQQVTRCAVNSLVNLFPLQLRKCIFPHYKEVRKSLLNVVWFFLCGFIFSTYSYSEWYILLSIEVWKIIREKMYYNSYSAWKYQKSVHTSWHGTVLVGSFYDTIKSCLIPVLCQCSSTKTSGLKSNKLNRKKTLKAPQCMCNITESLMSACKEL